MERYFILDKYNTWYDFHLILTEKTIPDAEPNTKYVSLDGMSGTLDLSESLTGEVTYADRTITAKFWTDYGTRKDREAILRQITASLHGKKIKAIEPDDPTHYFYGRAKIKDKKNNLAYAEFTVELICEPWRYSIDEAIRRVEATSSVTNVVIYNRGDRTVSPLITITGTVTLVYEGAETTLSEGTYKISDIRLRQGVNIIGVSGNGSVTFSYREADL